jgi:hypothetical protein
MPALIRRRSNDSPQESWHIFYCDVPVGWIGIRSGVPVGLDQWGWRCGFSPGMEPGQQCEGSAATFKSARTAFLFAWRHVLSHLGEANFEAFRRDRAFHTWKRRMWDEGVKLPTQLASGRSKSASVAPRSISKTPNSTSTKNTWPPMKYVAPRRYADPEVAARKIVELANAVEPYFDNRILIEKINGPFPYGLRGTPTEYKAGLDRAIEKGWLVLHESGTFVKFTQAGADLFA